MALSEHISEEIFDRYAARKALAAEILDVQNHITVCADCRAKLARKMNAEKAFAAIHSNFAFGDLAGEPEHLAYEQLEFFVDNKLDEVDREIATSHLAICGECERDLDDLRMYREIAVAAPVEIENTSVATSKKSLWQKIFALDSIGSFAPVAAILLVAALFGAWFLLRGNRSGEIAEITNNQNAAQPNVNLIINLPVQNSSPEISPSPEASPSEINSKNETLYALNDGALKVDENGNIQGTENLSPTARNLIKQSLQSGKIVVAKNSFGESSGVLMGENNSDKGVPFALQTPIGSIIRENQPVLRWKPLQDAQSYSAAIVDDKFRVVAESGKINSTNWKPSKPLPRGANYSWQVTAILADGTETVSPSAPAPQARFRVIEQNLNDEINRLEKSTPRSHLALGVLYAKAGLKREARAEFEKLVKENPKSEMARKLLQSVK